MKIKQIMFTEHLVGLGVSRQKAVNRPLTVHL